ncbi:MAG: hypothetical protein R3C11_14440 [Planctomycetaceae bacterium]
MKSSSYRNYAYGFSDVTANSTLGGIDRAFVDDTDEDDTVSLTSTSITQNSTSFAVTANSFDRVFATSTNGGNDSATVTDTSGNDNLAVKESKTTMQFSTGPIGHLEGFSSVTVNASSGGEDSALLYDSALDDTVILNPNSGSISRTGFNTQVNDFEKIVAYNLAGGDDTVTINDSNGDDRLVFDWNKAYLEGNGFKIAASGFNDVTVNANQGGTDLAHVNDTPGNDQLTMNETSTTLTGSGLMFTANNFERVYAYSNTGYDTATLTDSPGNDSFVGRHDWSYFRLPGTLLYVIDYAMVRVHATEGGTDRASLRDSNDKETFTLTPTRTMKQHSDFTTVVDGFEDVYSYSSGGDDVAKFIGSTEDDILIVKPDYSYLHKDGIETFAIGFPTLNVDGNGGANDVARLYDSAGDEWFWENGSYATYNTNGSEYKIEDFDKIHLYGHSGGNNILAEVVDLEAYYQTYGSWTNFIPAQAGSYLFDFSQPDADLTFTDARATLTQGIFPDKITIAFADPTANSSTLSMSVIGTTDKTITIRLATNGNGTITSTGSDVEALINGNSIANSLVHAFSEGTGSGIVEAHVATDIPDGIDPPVPPPS